MKASAIRAAHRPTLSRRAWESRWPGNSLRPSGAASTADHHHSAAHAHQHLTQCNSEAAGGNRDREQCGAAGGRPTRFKVGRAADALLVTRQPHEKPICDSGSSRAARHPQPARQHRHQHGGVTIARAAAAPSGVCVRDPLAIRVAEWPRRPASSRDPANAARRRRGRCARRAASECTRQGWVYDEERHGSSPPAMWNRASGTLVPAPT